MESIVNESNTYDFILGTVFMVNILYISMIVVIKKKGMKPVGWPVGKNIRMFRKIISEEHPDKNKIYFQGILYSFYILFIIGVILVFF